MPSQIISGIGAGDGGAAPGPSGGPVYDELIFMQAGDASSGSQNFGSSLSTRLNWGSALSPDGLTRVFDTLNGVWANSNSSQIIAPAGISSIDIDATFAVEIPGGSLTRARIVLVAAGFTSVNPQEYTAVGVSAVGAGAQVGVLNMLARNIPVSEGDYISLGLIYTGVGTARVLESTDGATNRAPTTKINVRMYA